MEYLVLPKRDNSQGDGTNRLERCIGLYISLMVWLC